MNKKRRLEEVEQTTKWDDSATSVKYDCGRETIMPLYNEDLLSNEPVWGDTRVHTEAQNLDPKLATSVKTANKELGW